MDYPKQQPGWQPPQSDQSRPLGFDSSEYPMNPPPYSNPANPPPYQGPGDTSQFQPPYPQQGGFQYPPTPGHQPAPYPQQGGYQDPYPPQPQGGYQPPYPNAQAGYQNSYPTDPGYQDGSQQTGYTEQLQMEDTKDKRKHKRFFSIIGGIVAAIIVICILVLLSSSGSDKNDKRAVVVTTKKPKATERPTLEPKQEKLVLENCTLVKNLTDFVNCKDLKNCRPIILSNTTDLPKEPEKGKNGTATPDVDLPQSILDSLVDIEFTSDSTSETDTKTVNATSVETLLNETVDASVYISNQTVDLSYLANCSQIYYCNASLICADGNFTLNDSKITAGTDKTVVYYRRPGFSPIVPLIIPLPVPIGGSKYKVGKKIKPKLPIGNPLKPGKVFGGFKKG